MSNIIKALQYNLQLTPKEIKEVKDAASKTPLSIDSFIRQIILYTARLINDKEGD